MSKRDALLLLQDMIDSALKIKKYTDGYKFDDFIADDKTVDGVTRNFEIIGEAANRLNEHFKNSNPEIEWGKLRGFRNRIVHEYFGIDYEIVWTIIEEKLEPLIFQLESIEKK